MFHQKSKILNHTVANNSCSLWPENLIQAKIFSCYRCRIRILKLKLKLNFVGKLFRTQKIANNSVDI